MRWNGQEYSDDIKKSIYVLLTEMEKAKALTMNNTDYADNLKKLHNGVIQGLRFKYQSVVMYCTDYGIEFDFQRPMNNAGDTKISLTWSMAARHIRAWELEKHEQPKTQEEQKMAFNLSPSANSGKLSMSNFLSDSGNTSTEKKIPLAKLVGWFNQPFKKYNDDKLKELAASIKENGLLSPITVRPITASVIEALRKQINDAEDKQEKASLQQRYDYYATNIGSYEVLSGHNRAEACKMLSWSEISAVVREDIDDAHAQLIMVDANLQQRHKLLPSELAFAYKAQRNALEAIGVRGATSDIADRYQVNRKTVWRYIKCTYLIHDMLEMLDAERFSLVTAVAISDLSAHNQQALADWLLDNPKRSIDEKAVAALAAHNSKGFSAEDINDILHPKKTSTVKAAGKTIKLTRTEITDIIGDSFSNDDITEFLYYCLQRKDLFDEWQQLPKSELDTYGLSEKCLSILKENGMDSKASIDEWITLGDGEKILGEQYYYEVTKKVFGDDDEEDEFDAEM